MTSPSDPGNTSPRPTGPGRHRAKEDRDSRTPGATREAVPAGEPTGRGDGSGPAGVPGAGATTAEPPFAQVGGR